MAATAKQLAALAKGRATRTANAKKKAAGKKIPAVKKKKSPKKIVKKNPEKRAVTAQFCVKLVTAGGKMGYISATAGDIVTTMDTSRSKAKKMLLKQAERIAQKFFNEKKRYLRKVEVVAIKKPHEALYTANPVPPSQSLQVKEAANLFEDFTGHQAGHVTKTKIHIPGAALQFGLCDGIMYETIRDGKTEHYCHKFKKSARPLLAAGSDGKSLHLVGGNYRFTNRGIVDN